MQRKHFIFILIAYIVVIIGGGVSVSLTRFLIPSAVVEIEEMDEPSLSVLIIGPIIILGAVVGLIGMLCFWRPAIYIFTAAVIAKIILSPILGTWKAVASWETVFGELEILLDGIIITLIFFGPAKNLFIKNKS